MHYYAFDNRYGIGTVDSDGDRIGTLHAFSSKAARDAWVDDEVWDGDYRREPISGKEAHAVLEYAARHTLYDPRFDLCPSMDTLVEKLALDEDNPYLGCADCCVVVH